jgi:threonine dehydrogenase-like Zn-dependent dehydrogenase
VPFAQANLALVPDALSDEQVLLLTDIASTGFAAAESGGVRLGDTVAVFAQGSIGLCATLGAKLMGASEILVVDRDPSRLEMAKRFGATVELLAGGDEVQKIRNLTDGRGVPLGTRSFAVRRMLSTIDASCTCAQASLTSRDDCNNKVAHHLPVAG